MKHFWSILCKVFVVILCVGSLSAMGSATDVNAATKTVKGSVWVNGTNVNVRENPDTKSKSLGKVNTGEELKLYENRSDGWSCVDYKGSEAYIKSEFLSGSKVLPIVPSKESTKSNSNGIKASSNSKSSNNTNTKATGNTVYITDKGECYHRSSSCSRMRSPRAVTLEEAIASGRRACSKCY